MIEIYQILKPILSCLSASFSQVKKLCGLIKKPRICQTNYFSKMLFMMKASKLTPEIQEFQS
jgi:hypothetical protein